MDIDECALLIYEIVNDKEEHEYFVVPEMKRNIILVRDWLKQFVVGMYCDLGCIQIGKSYVKMEEGMHISSLARLTVNTIMRPLPGKFCVCIAKRNKQLLNSNFNQAIPA